jgi:HK97 family phage portal protein
MSILTRIFGGKTEERSSSVNPALYFNGMGANTRAGSSITPDESLKLTTVYACVSKIAQTVATLERSVFKTRPAGREMISHPVTQLLTHYADTHTSAFDFWEKIVSDSLLYGKGYAYIERAGSRPTALIWLPAQNVEEMDAPDGATVYQFSPEKTGRVKANTFNFLEQEMVVISAFRGLSPIEYHRESLGLSKAALDFGASFFGSGGNLSGVLSVDKALTDEQFMALQNAWQTKYHGKSGQHATAILEHGIKYDRIGIPPDDAQFIETRKMQANEVARIFNVPAALVGLEANVSFSNVEQQNIFFASYTIAPLVKRIENELNNKLFTERERKTVEVEFDMASLLRADAVTRSSYYSTMLRDGVMTINEVRKIEGLNPTENGDTHFIPLNVIPLSKMESYGDKISTE